VGQSVDDVDDLGMSSDRERVVSDDADDVDQTA